MQANYKKTIKLSLVIPLNLNEKLEELAREACTSKADVLKKAIELIEIASKAKRDKKGIAIVDEDNHPEYRVIGF